MKLTVTKKQHRIMDDLLHQLDQRQRKYVEENSNLFPGASALPFTFVARISFGSRGYHFSIDCYLNYASYLKLPYFSASLYGCAPDVDIEWIWDRVRDSLLENWKFLREDVSNESVYFPLLDKD